MDYCDVASRCIGTDCAWVLCVCHVSLRRCSSDRRLQCISGTEGRTPRSPAAKKRRKRLLMTDLRSQLWSEAMLCRPADGDGCIERLRKRKWDVLIVFFAAHCDDVGGLRTETQYVSYSRLYITNLFTGSAFSLYCIFIWTVIFVLDNVWPGCLACWFSLKLSRSSPKVKVIFKVTEWMYIFRLWINDTGWREIMFVFKCTVILISIRLTYCLGSLLALFPALLALLMDWFAATYMWCNIF